MYLCDNIYIIIFDIIMKPLVSELDGKMDAIKKGKPNKTFYKFMRALSPIPYLAKARDCYVATMNKCAGMGNYAGIVGAPGAIMAVPFSFASNSSSLRDQDDDYRELMNAASQKERATTTVPPKLSDRELSPRSLGSPTDHSHLHKPLGVGRIDEECPCYFSGSFKKTTDKDIFPRTQSCIIVQKYQSEPKEKC